MFDVFSSSRVWRGLLGLLCLMFWGSVKFWGVWPLCHVLKSGWWLCPAFESGSLYLFVASMGVCGGGVVVPYPVFMGSVGLFVV